MNYEQKYKEALKVIGSLYNVVRYQSSSDALLASQTIEKAFPELKESEDERIRKALLDYFGECKKLDINPVRDAQTNTILAWLEKQGDKCLVNFDEAEQEKNDFVSGQFIECRKSFNEFKEFESYWLEYVGDDTYIGRSDNILNQRFHITPQQLFTLFTHQHCPKEEKPGAQKPVEQDTEIHDLWVYIREWNDKFGRLPKDEDELAACIDYVMKRQKPAWSEEDKLALKQAIYVCHQNGYTAVEDWLKSIKPQNRWKPSKEQLEALNAINNIGELSYVGQGGILVRLYNELKKL